MRWALLCWDLLNPNHHRLDIFLNTEYTRGILHLTHGHEFYVGLRFLFIHG